VSANFAISDGLLYALTEGQLAVELGITLPLKYSGESSMITLWTCGAWAFSPMNCWWARHPSTIVAEKKPKIEY